MSELSLNSSESWIDRLFSPTVKAVFLATVVGVTFFSEHDVNMSLKEGFVADIEDQEGWAEGGNTLRRVTFLGIAALGMLSLLLVRGKKFRLNLPTVFIAIYLLWAGASASWSIDPGTTIRRYSLVLCCAIGCFGFCKLIDLKDAVFAALLVSLAFLGLGVAAEIVLGTFRPHVGDYRFAGSMHPNIQAANLAIGSIAAYIMARIKPNLKVVFYGIFGFLFLFLILTKCRSATAAVPISLGFIWLASQPVKSIVIGVVSAFWVVSFACLICLVTEVNPIAENSNVLLLGRQEETGESLTGRLPLWEDLIEYIAVKPWQGYGFKAFWNPRHITDIAIGQEWTISEAHSSYVDTTLQLGIVGTLLLSLTAISMFFFSAITYRKTLQPGYLFLVGGVAFCIVRGFTESGLNGASSITAFLFLSLAAHCWNGDRISTDTDHNLDDHLSQIA